MINGTFLQIGGLIIFGGAALLLTGCALYSRIVHHRSQKWERKATWDELGRREGCAPLDLGSGSTALLLVHGFGDNPTVWKPMMEQFASRGFFCRAILLPGSGDTLEVRKTVSAAVWSSAIQSAVTALRQDHEKVWIVAHSLGSAISIRHALNHPESIAGLILLAPLLEVSNARSPLLSPRSWHKILGQRVPVNETPFSEDLRKPPPPDRAATEKFNTSNITDALFHTIDHIRHRAADLRIPVFVAVTPHDTVACPKAAEAWYDKTTNAPRRELFTAKNSAHVLPLDHDADHLVDEIVKFIAVDQ